MNKSHETQSVIILRDFKQGFDSNAIFHRIPLLTSQKITRKMHSSQTSDFKPELIISSTMKNVGASE